MGLTYAKLEALMLSQGKESKEVLKKIKSAQVIILDEAHILATSVGISVTASTTAKLPESATMLKKIQDKWIRLCDEHKEKAAAMMESVATKGHATQHLAESIYNPGALNWNEQKRAWASLKTLVKENKIEEDDAVLIRDIISLMSNTNLILGYTTTNEGKTGTVQFSAGQVKKNRAIKEFLKAIPGANVCFVSGTLFEPYSGFFEGIAGREVKQIVFPDVRQGSKHVTLIPDSWKLTSWNFDKKMGKIIERIQEISQKEGGQPIYLIAPNKRKEVVIRDKLKEMGIPGIIVDHYRSKWSMGVERKERICITVGLAEIPVNTLDPLAKGKSNKELWLDSRRLRMQGVQAATWQAVNRVRDPTGKAESRVYFIGCTADQVKDVSIWGTDRILGIQGRIKEITILGGIKQRVPTLKAEVEDLIEMPCIIAHIKNAKDPGKTSTEDYIKYIDPFVYVHRDLPKVSTISNRHIRQYRCAYNYPEIGTNLDAGIDFLNRLFVFRRDCYAQQRINPANNKAEYYKVCEPLTADLLADHILGKTTLGVYEVGSADTVTWCAFDIDTHGNQDTDAEGKLWKVLLVLWNHCIPFLLEASGSPHSYHVWIFLAETRTYNAFRFIRQINAESGANIEEVWPKQESVSPGGLGNLIKLPICTHLKTGTRSVFLNPRTLEPITGAINVPGVVHLMEIPRLVKSQVKDTDTKDTKDKKRFRAPTGYWKGRDLNYCMVELLKLDVLNGSTGDNMRVAIATKAHLIGMEPDDIARLFTNQGDYDFEYSLKKVKRVGAGEYQYPWSCETLRDKCGGLVSKYCRVCPRYKGAAGAGVEA